MSRPVLHSIYCLTFHIPKIEVDLKVYRRPVLFILCLSLHAGCTGSIVVVTSPLTSYHDQIAKFPPRGIATDFVGEK